jgi:Ca-activated chloride channel homolog
MVRARQALCVVVAALVAVTGCAKGTYTGHKAAESAPAAGAIDRAMYAAPNVAERAQEGQGPGQGGDKYDVIVENPFVAVKTSPLSTFSIDVDTASYSKTRLFLTEHNQLPPPDAVRIEELVNYFVYHYAPPTNEHPFAVHAEVAQCPWTPAHRLVRIGIKGKELPQQQRPRSNLVFLLDVSGSMDQPNKLPLLKRGMKMLIEALGENDRVAIAVYAGAAGLVLPPTNGSDKRAILGALEQLEAGGSTNGGEGIQLAYRLALDNFISGGTNRVILCTDGDFNVGTTSTSDLIRLVQEHARQNVFLSVLGFGMGNHNDAMLEQISDKGNGNYAFIDTDNEARKVLVEQMSATLVTIAKDVKIQVEFNPVQVAAYRLIGYENRMLAAEDFKDDKKDAGDIGAGHTVTALYEVVPVGAEGGTPVATVDPLRYQGEQTPNDTAASGELLTLKLRYKQPEASESQQLAFALTDGGQTFATASPDFRFAAAVAAFGMLLRDSQFKGDASYDTVLDLATAALDDDRDGYRHEFLELVGKAKALAR